MQEKYCIIHRLYAMKTYWKLRCSSNFLASALDRGELSASRPGRFIPWERAPCTHWILGFVGLKSRSGRCGEEKNLGLTGIDPEISSS
jgi:hypothetical protein